jgi:cobalt-precorrin-5B (C1)-methyltransferase
MILVFGGTTEGRIAVKKLEEAGNTYYYSTRGDEQEVVLQHGIRLMGAMDAAHLTSFCQ